MNDELLKRILGKLRVPAADDTAVQRVRHRAIAAFERPAPIPERSTAAWQWFAAATACALTLFFSLRPHHDQVRPGQAPSADNADSKLLSEMEALFPGQLDAIVTSGSDISIELAVEPGVTGQQRLAITLRRGPKTVRILGYSGRKVCLTLDGQRTCFEPLLDAEGSVILAGDDFVWSAQNPNNLTGYRIVAKPLAAR